MVSERTVADLKADVTRLRQQVIQLEAVLEGKRIDVTVRDVQLAERDRRIAELTDALQRCDQIDQWSMESDTKVWVAVCGYCGAVSTDIETPVPHDDECPTAIARAAIKGVSR